MLSDIIGFKEGIKVLDVGGGVGRHVIELSNMGAHCIGLDAAEDAINVINQIQNDFGLNVKGIYGDTCNLPFDDETFDVVMSNEFFEHVTDIDQAKKNYSMLFGLLVTFELFLEGFVDEFEYID